MKLIRPIVRAEGSLSVDQAEFVARSLPEYPEELFELHKSLMDDFGCLGQVVPAIKVE